MPDEDRLEIFGTSDEHKNAFTAGMKLGIEDTLRNSKIDNCKNTPKVAVVIRTLCAIQALFSNILLSGVSENDPYTSTKDCFAYIAKVTREALDYFDVEMLQVRLILQKIPSAMKRCITAARANDTKKLEAETTKLAVFGVKCETLVAKVVKTFEELRDNTHYASKVLNNTKTDASDHLENTTNTNQSRLQRQIKDISEEVNHMKDQLALRLRKLADASDERAATEARTLAIWRQIANTATDVILAIPSCVFTGGYCSLNRRTQNMVEAAQLREELKAKEAELAQLKCDELDANMRKFQSELRAVSNKKATEEEKIVFMAESIKIINELSIYVNNIMQMVIALKYLLSAVKDELEDIVSDVDEDSIEMFKRVIETCARTLALSGVINVFADVAQKHVKPELENAGRALHGAMKTVYDTMMEDMKRIEEETQKTIDHGTEKIQNAVDERMRYALGY